MAGYESDSSEGEFTETNVLLGYASREADDDVISRLGGQPVSEPFGRSDFGSLTHAIGLARPRCASDRRFCPLQSMQIYDGPPTPA